MQIIYSAPTWAILTAGIFVALGAGALIVWRWADDLEEALIMGGCVTAIVACISVGLPMAMRASADYTTWCEAQGGHVDSSSQVGTTSTVSGNGQVGVGTTVTTTTYCLTVDGRIIDVS